jgi:nucleoside-diphosphate-sugar epimerase
LTQNADESPRKRLADRRVVVTGGRGFIGRRLIAALLREGAEVTAILRSGHDAAALRTAGVRVEIAALTDPAAMSRILAGCDTLFHFAYDVRASGSDNLAAFHALTRAAADVRVGRIVHASSAVVYDDWPAGRIGPGAAITQGQGGDYRRTKAAMEQALTDGPTPAAILQPTIVYGPGSALWTDAPIRALRAGGIVLPDPPGLCPAIHVDDVAEAAICAALLPDLGRERFLLAGPDRLTWAEFFGGYADLIGTGPIILRPNADLAARLGPPPATHTPAGPSTTARLSGVLRRVLGSRRFDTLLATLRARREPAGPLYPDRTALALYAASPVLDLSLSRTRLGFAPRLDFRQGLATLRP